MEEFIRRLKKGLENFGLYYGIYSGIVIEHDKTNPHKLRLKIPSVWGEALPSQIYATAEGVMGGRKYGMMIAPQIGDIVWVKFRYGNPSAPVWSFTGFGKDERPKEYLHPEVFGFRTPNGNLITIDDVDGIIRVKHQDIEEEGEETIVGAEIKITNDIVSVVHMGHTIEMSKDSVKMKLREDVKLTIENDEQNLYSGLSDLITEIKAMLIDTPQGLGTVNTITTEKLDEVNTNLNKILE